jgi:hypothetical protein
MTGGGALGGELQAEVMPGAGGDEREMPAEGEQHRRWRIGPRRRWGNPIASLSPWERCGRGEEGIPIRFFFSFPFPAVPGGSLSGGISRNFERNKGHINIPLRF